ncbi:Transcription factor TFIIIB component B [Mactra antiquata]
MATRRSRLQIKPNILGGAKSAPAKTSGKTLDITKATNNDNKETPVLRSPKVKSPTRITSPRRNVSVNKQTDADKTLKDNKKIEKVSDNVTVGVKSDLTKPVESASDHVNEDVGNKKSESTVAPTRARIRKFAKVNINAARDVKNDKKPNSDSSSTANVNKKIPDSDTSSQKDEDITNTLKSSQTSVEKNQTTVNKDNSKKSNIVPPARRSRFPKAKPNVVDIGQRKPRTQIQEIVVYPDADVPDTGSKTVEFSLKDNVDNEKKVKKEEYCHSNQSQSITQPSTTTTSVVSKSPLKHPVPVVPSSPEKRVRTLSTSEPVVVKRQKRPIIDAPTDQPPDRSTMKMRDLIRWNPSSNPMKVNPKKQKQDTSKEKENVLSDEPETNEDVNTDKTKNIIEEDDGLPVPQVTIGPDGNIVINEKSLVVKDPELDKAPSQDDDVIDETDTFTTYGSFRKSTRSKRWSDKETKKFYKALAMIGIDFFLICKLFPGRTRFDIKKKFQKEEKVNRPLIDKVLRERINFDPAMFENKEDSSSDEEVKKSKKKEPKKPSELLKSNYVPSGERNSKKSRVSRKRHKKRSYYESDTTDEEPERDKLSMNKRSNLPGEPCQQTNVSQKDGEVVNILMDMSEGRLNIEGQNEETEAEFIATPLNVHLQQTANSKFNVSVKSSSNSNVHSDNNIRTHLVLNADNKLANAESLHNINTSLQQYSNENFTKLKLPVVAKSGNVRPSNTIQPAVITKPQQSLLNQGPFVGGSLNPVQQMSLLHNPLQQQGLDLSSLQQSNNVLQGEPIKIQSDDNDQYVLVTVVPEGGGETVIHVYRLNGGVDLGNTETVNETTVNYNQTALQNNTGV